ncbi:MAG: hypothetical protein WC812_04440 [Candidatus Pacearchaeota archaeon]|jgi:hypothetical protein
MKNKKAAMEMSMGTIVTIILLVVLLVLGIFFIQRIFSSGTNAIDQIDSQVQSEINKIFTEEGKTLAIYPSSRQITLKTGDDPKGFAFSYKNDINEKQIFEYTVYAEKNFDYTTKCGSGFTEAQANGFLVTNAGSFTLQANQQMDLPGLVLFGIPENAPACTIPYNLVIEGDKDSGSSANIFVTIK